MQGIWELLFITDIEEMKRNMFVIMKCKIPLNNAKKFILGNAAAAQKNALPTPPGEQIVVAGKSTLKGSEGIVIHTATKETVGEILNFYNNWMGQLQDIPGLEYSVDVYMNSEGITTMLGIQLP